MLLSLDLNASLEAPFGEISPYSLGYCLWPVLRSHYDRIFVRAVGTRSAEVKIRITFYTTSCHNSPYMLSGQHWGLAINIII